MDSYNFLKDLLNGFMYKNVPFTALNTPSNLDKVSKFEFRSNDVMLLSFPKSGTHLLAEIVSRILLPEKSTNTKSVDRIPFLDMTKYFDQEINKDPASLPMYVDDIAAIPLTTQRLFRTHLYYDLLNKTSLHEIQPKIIYVWRNIFDAAVSYFHFYKKRPELGYYNGTWDDYFKLYVNGHVIYGNYFDHAKSWLNKNNKLNILIVQYESILENPHNEVKRIAEFLGQRDKISDEFLERVVEECSFSKMKDNPLILDGICRKGIVGDWKNYFSEDQKNQLLKKFNDELTPLGLKMKYE